MDSCAVLYKAENKRLHRISFVGGLELFSDIAHDMRSSHSWNGSVVSGLRVGIDALWSYIYGAASIDVDQAVSVCILSECREKHGKRRISLAESEFRQMIPLL